MEDERRERGSEKTDERGIEHVARSREDGIGERADIHTTYGQRTAVHRLRLLDGAGTFNCPLTPFSLCPLPFPFPLPVPFLFPAAPLKSLPASTVQRTPSAPNNDLHYSALGGGLERDGTQMGLLFAGLKRAFAVLLAGLAHDGFPVNVPLRSPVMSLGALTGPALVHCAHCSPLTTPVHKAGCVCPSGAVIYSPSSLFRRCLGDA